MVYTITQVGALFYWQVRLPNGKLYTSMIGHVTEQSARNSAEFLGHTYSEVI